MKTVEEWAKASKAAALARYPRMAEIEAGWDNWAPPRILPGETRMDYVCAVWQGCARSELGLKIFEYRDLCIARWDAEEQERQRLRAKKLLKNQPEIEI